MLSQVCRTILATGLLNCGPTITDPHVAREALERAMSTAGTGESSPFLIRRDDLFGDCVVTVRFAPDVPLDALSAITIDVERLRKSVTQGDRSIGCIYAKALDVPATKN